MAFVAGDGAGYFGEVLAGAVERGHRVKFSSGAGFLYPSINRFNIGTLSGVEG